MQQAQFTLTSPLIEFLRNYQTYGFTDQSTMVQVALQRFREELELQSLKQSAALYAEIYEADTELQALTEMAIQEWPE